MRMRRAEGVLLVDKPAGMTSHDAVAIARRALAERRIGHGGTLDPFATGLLVMLVGSATRLFRFLDAEPKVYEATIRFGTGTDTDDLTGVVIRTAPLPDREKLDRAIAQLTGTFEQMPPAYSARQVGGVRSYRAARAGKTLELTPTTVTVHGWTVRHATGDELDVTISCSGGTYVRALARDLGQRAGSAAHLAALRRVRSGPFSVSEAVPPEDVTPEALRPAREAVRSLPLEPLDDQATVRARHGALVPASVEGAAAALLAPDGSLIGIGERRGAQWHPCVVVGGD